MKRKQYYLFVPGYYGSSLVDKESGDLLFVSLRELLIGQKTLALPIPGLKIPGTLDLAPQDLVEKVSIAGPLYSISGYSETMRLLKSLSAKDPQCVIPVPYDWRKDPIEAVKKIDRKVKEIRSREPNAHITLVSHSLGSAISAYYLRYGTQDYFKAKENWEGLHQFNKVVMSAAPFRGTLAIFRNMYHGIKVGLNANFLSPLAYSSFPSSYFLLPPEDDGVALTDNLQEVRLSLWDPKQWWKNEWGLFHEKIGLKEQNLPAMKRFVTKWLKRAQKFHELNMAPLEKFPSKTPILYLQGIGAKTVYRGVWMQSLPEKNVFLLYEKDFKKWKSQLNGISDEVVYREGDTTLAVTSSELPPAFREIGTHVLRANLEHLKILQDPSSQAEVKNFLIQ